MAVTASTSAIACTTTDKYTMPDNPSNLEELLKFLEDSKTTVTEGKKLLEKLVNAGVDLNKEDIEKDESLKSNADFQDFLYYVYKGDVVFIKTYQYLQTLSNDEQTQFVSDQQKLLDDLGMKLYFPVAESHTNGIIDNIFGDIIANESEHKAVGSQLMNVIKSFYALVQDDKFKIT